MFQPNLVQDGERFFDELPTIRELVVLDGDAAAAGAPLQSFSSGASPDEPEVGLDADDTAFICFSSGTTGTPKGVVHTHDDAIACAHLGQYILNVRRSDVLLNAFTPSFIGWENMIFPFVMAGGTTVLMGE